MEKARSDAHLSLVLAGNRKDQAQNDGAEQKGNGGDDDGEIPLLENEDASFL